MSLRENSVGRRWHLTFKHQSAYCLITMSVAAVLLTPAARAQDEQPKIGVSPSQLRFGSVAVSKTKSTKIRNHGKADLEISAVIACTGTSAEFSWSQAAPFTVEPKKSTKLDVTYAPTDAGRDEGCLEIISNDPRRGRVEVFLRGQSDNGDVPAEGPEIDLDPSTLEFGEVLIGGSSRRSFKVKNKGTKALEGVTVGRCFETSPEYTWNPTDMFSVPPDESVKVRVTYSPTAVGDDEGCLAIVSNDADENPAILDISGSGVEGTAGIDLDITRFKVKKSFDPGARDDIFVHLWVRNEGNIDEPATAMVIGMQGGIVVYEETLSVADKSGNRGSKKYTFPPFTPSQAGEILWLATVEDGDPDLDEAYAITDVEGPDIASVDVDLDAVRFKVTKKVSLARGGSIRLRAWFENPGLIDETKQAALVGFQNGVEIYNQVLDVADRPGDEAATMFAFPGYAADSVGDIVWTVTVADDDPDTDVRSAVTRVKP